MPRIRNIGWADEEEFVGPFYHGTSTALNIERLVPALESGVLREEWRTSLVNKVFFTDSLHSARQYAKKAAQKYSGTPVEHIVAPQGNIWNINNTEYVADYADIKGTV